MAKIFYVTESAPDYSQCHFFKTEKEALEYGISQLPQFDMYDDPMNDEEADGEEWYAGDSINVKEGFLYFVEDGEPVIKAMTEEEAKQLLEEEDFYEETGGIYFPAKLPRGAFGYFGRDTDYKGGLWSFYNNQIEESKSTKGLKYVKLFEQFVFGEDDYEVELNPADHLYGPGSGFRTYGTDPAELEGEAAAALKKYSKYIGKTVSFKELVQLRGEVPLEIANGGGSSFDQVVRSTNDPYPILDVRVFTDLDGFHPWMEPNSKKMKKKGYENFVVGFALADAGLYQHVNVISAPPSWFEKNAKFNRK